MERIKQPRKSTLEKVAIALGLEAKQLHWRTCARRAVLFAGLVNDAGGTARHHGSQCRQPRSGDVVAQPDFGSASAACSWRAFTNATVMRSSLMG